MIETCRNPDNMKITRPVLRYHGGKWRLAPWIIANMPEHRVYIEPFGGGGSVLIRKPRSHTEIYNDLDGEVCNVFRVLRDSAQSTELERLMQLTPYAREEFDLAFERCPEDPIEQARRSIFRAFASVGSDGFTRPNRTGFRSYSKDIGAQLALQWKRLPNQVSAWVERLRGVLIENRPAEKVIEVFDNPRCLIYADPPYVTCTRNSVRNGGKAYRHEMTDEDHCRLAELLHNVEGMVMLSGYDCELYRRLYGDWQMITKEHIADRAKITTECLWFSPNVEPIQMILRHSP